jgi:hypothetical protein
VTINFSATRQELDQDAAQHLGSDRPRLSRPTGGGARGTTINRLTLWVKYGWLGIDVTQRLLGHATWTASGLFAADANVPTGNHRISVSIADNLGRVSTRVANLNVLK